MVGHYFGADRQAIAEVCGQDSISAGNVEIVSTTETTSGRRRRRLTTSRTFVVVFTVVSSVQDSNAVETRVKDPSFAAALSAELARTLPSQLGGTVVTATVDADSVTAVLPPTSSPTASPTLDFDVLCNEAGNGTTLFDVDVLLPYVEVVMLNFRNPHVHAIVFSVTKIPAWLQLSETAPGFVVPASGTKSIMAVVSPELAEVGLNAGVLVGALRGVDASGSEGVQYARRLLNSRTPTIDFWKNLA